ncbi:hypothetical protein COL940_013042 [Colletotrichum noveboracense]|nr:hypothetical protein COL940_013042 [Colletotrichum noveboracense]
MDDKAPPTVGKGAIIMINSPKSFGGMDIEDITMKETTSDFTSRRSATTRYWKAPLKFKKKGKVADSLHISNIKIPYFKQESMEEKPIDISTLDLTRTSWQNVNSTNKTIGVLGGDVMFHPNNIRVLMDATERGIVVKREFSFFVKSSREQDMKIPLEERAP